jgi:hypothetical protein
LSRLASGPDIVEALGLREKLGPDVAILGVELSCSVAEGREVRLIVTLMPSAEEVATLGRKLKRFSLVEVEG